MKNLYLYGIIGVLIIIILLLRSCGPTPSVPEPKIVTKVDTVYKTIEKTVTVHKPGPTRIDTVTVEVPTKVDTAAILKDYFAKVDYDYVIPIDSFGVVKVKETISQNRIQDRTIVTDIKIPTITKTTTITLPPERKTQLYVGFEIAGNKSYPVNYFGPNFTLKTKSDQLYNLGIGMSPGGATLKLGTSWKIKLK